MCQAQKLTIRYIPVIGIEPLILTCQLTQRRASCTRAIVARVVSGGYRPGKFAGRARGPRRPAQGQLYIYDSYEKASASTLNLYVLAGKCSLTKAYFAS